MFLIHFKCNSLLTHKLNGLFCHLSETYPPFSSHYWIQYLWFQYSRRIVWMYLPRITMSAFTVQAALVICGLFICDFAYMRSKICLFSGTYPLIYSHPWSFYMRIRYMRAYFLSPYLSHITRSTCTEKRNWIIWKFDF